MTSDAAPYTALSQQFRRFAVTQCAETSPLYWHLATAIADDPEMLALAARCRPEQPAPNLLFGAVHFLLLQGQAAPLARFHPGLTATPDPPDRAYPHFRAFCRLHQPAIQDIIAWRRVQTNEINRCSYLLPAFCLVAERARRPLALLEIGTSAGLNLLWDRYRYRYRHAGTTLKTGPDTAPVVLETELRGPYRPPLPASLPPVGYRAGIDLNSIDTRDPTEACWLRALIWPEHRDRMARLQAAIALRQQTTLMLDSGDALHLLPDRLAQVPAEYALVVFHTHVLNQFSPLQRRQLDTLLHAAATHRSIFRLGNDMGDGGAKQYALKLLEMHNGTTTGQHIANCDGHGRWLEWLVETGAEATPGTPETPGGSYDPR